MAKVLYIILNRMPGLPCACVAVLPAHPLQECNSSVPFAALNG